MRLLILKCSARKRGDDVLLPVLERYDGPLWQVLRSYIRAQPDAAADLAIYGLSAEYGLISAATPIPDYERTMAPERADELRPRVIETFGQLMGERYDKLCLGISNRYLRAMCGWQSYLPSGLDVTITDGPMGAKLGQLRAWLEGRTWVSPAADRPVHLIAAEAPRGKAVLAGVHIRLTRDEALVKARAALAADGAGADRYRDWYVLLDGRPVAAKWVAGVISGLPTSKFDAANARRVLLALGIDVERAV